MLTSQGFKRMRYADYLPILEEQAKELWGDDVDLTDRSPLGKFIKLQAYQRAEDNELMENLYNSRFVDTSEGVALEQNVKRALITKKEWRKASGQVKLTLKKGTPIPIDTMFSKKYGVKYKTIEEVTAIEDGDYLVNVEALEYGQIGNAEPNEITEIVNPISGLLAVTNSEAFRNGQDEESDEELKARYYSSLGKLGNRRTETIRATVLDEVEGVRSCLVIENDTLQTDADGRPGKSFETIVLGGEREEIAQKIFQSKPESIRAYGKETVQVVDSQNMSVTIGFTYAETIQIYVKAMIKKGSNYPIDGDTQVIDQIVKFIGGTNNNVQYNGLGMSEDVIQARLEARLFNVEGVEDAKIFLSTDGVTYDEINIDIGFAQVAETDSSKIEVSDLV
ncbi:baseplate J/gp47 family protein [Heyndrickxia oleronia]|uniref:baseplate J/gp47 family protein n=1 Tax=Heyndrickxia oleronia TaxID=38875 RepID=UPI001C0EBBA3|nr:baseplate J/gp47 family protein [Heyndrickxia oleronia]MBU5214347.1 baseplate J/gp47 family protein [Heyndrickxia oleronia]